MEYKIVSLKVTGILTHDVKKCAEALTKEVNDPVALGWETPGGVALGHTGTCNQLRQAMIKRR